MFQITYLANLPGPKELSSILGCRDRQLYLTIAHGDLGIKGALMEHGSVHFHSRVNKLGHVDSHMGDKFNSH